MICRNNFRVASAYSIESVGISTIMKPIANASYRTVELGKADDENNLVKDFHELSNDVFLLLQLIDLGLIQNRLEQASSALHDLYGRLVPFVEVYGPIKGDDHQNLTDLVTDDEFIQAVRLCSFDRIKTSIEFLDGKDHISFPKRLYRTIIAQDGVAYQRLKLLRDKFIKDGTAMRTNVQANIFETFIDIINLSPEAEDEVPKRFSQKQRTPEIYTQWLEAGKDSDLFATHLWAFYLEGIRRASDGSIEFGGNLDLDLEVTFNTQDGQWGIVCNPKTLLEAIRFYKFLGKDGNPAYVSKCQVAECSNMITNARRTFCSNSHGLVFQNRVRLFNKKFQKTEGNESQLAPQEEPLAAQMDVAKQRPKKKYTTESDTDTVINTVKVKG
jgi:hypothetical protein